VVLSSISPPFGRLFRTPRQITHVLLTRAPLYSPPCGDFLARLACVRHAASVRSEPGSNSPIELGVEALKDASLNLGSRPSRLRTGSTVRELAFHTARRLLKETACFRTPIASQACYSDFRERLASFASASVGRLSSQPRIRCQEPLSYLVSACHAKSAGINCERNFRPDLFPALRQPSALLSRQLFLLPAELAGLLLLLGRAVKSLWFACLAACSLAARRLAGVAISAYLVEGTLDSVLKEPRHFFLLAACGAAF
jgi:hypothetical protein